MGGYLDSDTIKTENQEASEQDIANEMIWGEREACKPEEDELANLDACINEIEIFNMPDEGNVDLFEVNGIPAVSQGAITLITGREKSGKSNFTGLLMAAAIAKNHQAIGGYIKALKPGMKILYVDTEQPAKDARRTLQRVCRTAGFDAKENWTKHGIRTASVRNGGNLKNRLKNDNGESDIYEIRKMIVERATGMQHADLVIVDGIADLMANINDIEKVNQLVDWIEYFIDENKCALVVVLHEKGDNTSKAMGWLGTRLQQKMTDRFYVVKITNTFPPHFRVEKMSRGVDMEKLEFVIAGDHWELFNPQKAAEDLQKACQEKEAKMKNDLTVMFAGMTEDGPTTRVLAGRMYNQGIYHAAIKEYTSIKSLDGCSKFITKASNMGIIHSDHNSRGQVKRWFMGPGPVNEETEFEI